MKLCGFDVGIDKPFFLLAGPCVVESEQLQLDVAGTLKRLDFDVGSGEYADTSVIGAEVKIKAHLQLVAK